jgi:NAD(P)-dependent dehydrogenase (short-subunit alcohol dehydrogenase family)
VLGASAEGGTGWRVAECFAHHGAHVFVAARSTDGINRLAAKIGGTAVTCDASLEDDVEKLAKQSAKRTGAIDAAVYAAGQPIAATLVGASRHQLEQSFAVNLFGAFAFLREVAPRMTRGSAISLLSSLSSTHVFPGLAPYGVAKAGLNALVKYAAIEFAPLGVRVNALLPGLIETPMAQSLLSVAREQVMREVPLGQPVQPEEIAAMCLFLCLDAPSITGATIPIDGGNHLRRAPFPGELPQGLFPD